MKLLAIDTSTNFLCLGLYQQGRFYEYNLQVSRRLSCLLSPTIKRALDALGWRAGDVDYFACGLGPGSFTGLRVGLAAIKGMAWALNKPVAGIPTLDILAAGVSERRRPVAVILDARRGLVYCGIYENKKGKIKKAAPYMLLNEKELLKAVKPGSIILGDAAGLYKEKLLNKIKGTTISGREYWHPRAHAMIELTLARIKDKKISGPFEIKPVYLYPKECQVK